VLATPQTDTSRKGYCATKRQFLFDHVEKVIYVRGKVTILGTIGDVTRPGREADALMGDRAVKFKIEARIDKGGLEPPMSVQLPALSMSPSVTEQIGSGPEIALQPL
jgi:hypothetical protein